MTRLLTIAILWLGICGCEQADSEPMMLVAESRRDITVQVVDKFGFPYRAERVKYEICGFRGYFNATPDDKHYGAWTASAPMCACTVEVDVYREGIAQGISQRFYVSSAADAVIDFVMPPPFGIKEPPAMARKPQSYLFVRSDGRKISE